MKPYVPVIEDPILEPWRWRHEEALGGYQVLCMTETAAGDLWFGNIGNIVHYDGIQTTELPFDDDLLSIITHKKDIPWAKFLHSLPNDDLLALIGESVVLRSGNQWSVVIPDVGESEFDACLYEGQQGEFWLIVPDGVWRISADLSDAVKVLSPASDRRFMSGCIDQDYFLWLVERPTSGVPVLRRTRILNDGLASESTQYDISLSDAFGEVSLAAGDDGVIWYGDRSGDSALIGFDPQTAQWIVPDNENLPTKLTSVVKGRDGSIWGGASGEIVHVSRDRKTVSHYLNVSLPLSVLPMQLYESTNDRLWVLSRKGAVYSVDVGDDEWLTYTGINFQCETDEGVHWYITESRRYIVSHNPSSGVWRKYGIDEDFGKDLGALFYSSHGLIWGCSRVNSKCVVLVFDGVAWRRIDMSNFARWVEPNSFMEAADGTVWCGAGGIFISDVPGAGGALQFKVNEDRTVELLHHYSPPEFPYYVTALEQTDDGVIWVGSTFIHRYDGGKSGAVPWTHIRGDNSTDMTLDRAGQLWVSKDNFGVCRWDGDAWSVFTEADGVAGLISSGLLSLNDGSILAASDHGISRFDGDAWVKYAFPESFLMRSRWSGMRQTSNGAIWFSFNRRERATAQSLVNDTKRIRTVRYIPETDPPETYLSETLDEVAHPGNLRVDWFARDRWSHTTAEELQYSWKLNDGEWSSFSYEKGTTLLSLDAGHHVLRVRSRDQAFNIDPTPASVEFRVIPPVWKQPWFIALISTLVGLIVLLIWVVMKVREFHLIERQKERETLLIEQQKNREEFLLKEREQREQHLQEMDRLKTGFFTNISHELRTPVTVIAGRLETLLKAEGDLKKQSSLSTVLRNVQRVSSLITQLLDFRKIEEGTLAVVATRGDLVPLLREWADSMSVLAEKKNIECRLEVPDECVGLFDFDKVQKIATNLISNAVKYTPSGGKVRVILTEESGSEPDQRRVNLTIEDTGLGISEENLKHIFDRFYRVSEESMAVGAGIGLNLTKELIDLLGGSIDVESPVTSDPECPGSRFTVTLPLEHGVESEQSGAASVMHAPDKEELGGSNRTDARHDSTVDDDAPIILTVEDDEDIQDFIVEGLESTYQVKTAKNGAIGLQMAKELVPDLIITDVMMPEMDGVEMCAALKTSMETSHIPVVMLTAKSAVDSQVQGLKTGADDYITKPFHMEVLEARIENLLESRRLLRERFEKEMPVLTAKVPENTPEKEFMDKALSMIDEHYADWEFKADHFAKLMGMSLRTLHRKMKAVAGRTPSEFINEFRMVQAAELLTSTTYSITDITFQVGYDDSSHFARMFKKRNGMSPTQYRAEHKVS